MIVNSGTVPARFSLYPEEYEPAEEDVVAAAAGAAGVPANWKPDHTPTGQHILGLDKYR